MRRRGHRLWPIACPHRDFANIKILFLDIKSIFDVLDQVSVTSTGAEVKAKKLESDQNSLAENVRHHVHKIADIKSNVTKLNKEMNAVDNRVKEAVENGLPWDLLTAVMRFIHDRSYEDREVISHSSQDPKISDFVSAIDTTQMKFVLKDDLDDRLDNLDEKYDRKHTDSSTETKEKVRQSSCIRKAPKCISDISTKIYF